MAAVRHIGFLPEVVLLHTALFESMSRPTLVQISQTVAEIFKLRGFSNSGRLLS